MKSVLSVIVNNSSGVLSHVSGLFTRRGYNIDSLSVGTTQDRSKSVITLVVDEEEQMVKQIIKQLYKVVDVIRIDNLTHEESLKRELVLMKVKVTKKNRSELFGLIDAFKAIIVDMTEDSAMLELSGWPRKIDAFIQVMSEFGIIEMARTGTIALAFSHAFSHVFSKNKTEQ